MDSIRGARKRRNTGFERVKNTGCSAAISIVQDRIP